MPVSIARPLLRYGLFGFLTLFLLLVPRAAPAGSIAQLSQNIIDYCNHNLQTYQNAMALTHGHATPPVPPEMDPPCFQCGGPHNTEAVQNVNAWVAQAEEPESDAIKFLLSLARMGQTMGDLTSELSAPAQKCWKQFDWYDAENNAKTIMSVRLFNDKAVGMATQYHKNPKMSYAGVTFLLKEARADETITGDSSAENSAIDSARQWQSGIEDWAKQEIYSNYNWKFCPAYVFLARQLETMGGQATDASQYEADMQKLLNFTKFKMTMELKVDGSNPAGDKMELSWKGSADMSLTFDSQKGCYTPVIAGNNVAFQLESWTFTTKDGSEVQFDSPSNFNAPVSRLSLNLCDANPMLHIVFANYGPGEDATAKDNKGHTQGVHLQMFGGMMALALEGQKALSGSVNKSEAEQKISEINSLKAQLQAHQGDQQWLMGPEGQAVLEKIEAAAAAAGGTATGTGPGLTGIAPAAIQYDVGVNWTNGTADVVDQKISMDHTNGGTLNDDLQVTITQSQ
jgi:hypothetical protein